MSKQLGAGSAAGADAFSEAARSGLTALNATALVVCTAVSAALSLLADIGGSAGSQFTAYVAFGSWLASIVLALYLAGRNAADAAGPATVTRAVAQGLRMVRARPGFAAVVLMLSLGATFTVWSRARSDHGGALASMGVDLRRAVAAAESVGITAAAINQDTDAIKAVLTKPASPAEQLARQGLGRTPQAVCDVLSKGDLQSARLLKAAGVEHAPVSVTLGGGQFAFCLEEAFLEKTEEALVSQALGILPMSKDDLRRVYLVQSVGMGSDAGLQPMTLLAKVGLAGPGRVRLSSVRATPLVMAIWRGDIALVDALLAQGADPNESARYDFGIGARMETVGVSPLTEAERLGRAGIATGLKASGGLPSMVRLPYFS